MFKNKKRTYVTPAKPSVIVENGAGWFMAADSLLPNRSGDGGRHFTPVLSKAFVFPSKSRAKAALSKIIKGLPPKADPNDEPLYSVEVIR